MALTLLFTFDKMILSMIGFLRRVRTRVVRKHFCGRVAPQGPCLRSEAIHGWHLFHQIIFGRKKL